MKVNFYLKADLHSSIFPLTESVTEPVHRKISLYVGILDDILGGNLLQSFIMFLEGPKLIST